jgi:hypothetical protein
MFSLLVGRRLVIAPNRHGQVNVSKTYLNYVLIVEKDTNLCTIFTLKFTTFFPLRVGWGFSPTLTNTFLSIFFSWKTYIRHYLFTTLITVTSKTGENTNSKTNDYDSKIHQETSKLHSTAQHTHHTQHDIGSIMSRGHWKPSQQQIQWQRVARKSHTNEHCERSCAQNKPILLSEVR